MIIQFAHAKVGTKLPNDECLPQKHSVLQLRLLSPGILYPFLIHM